MNYENYLINEMQEGEDKWCSKCEAIAEECRCDHDLDKTESFTGWLDAQGDTLAPADSFTQWLNQSEDKI